MTAGRDGPAASRMAPMARATAPAGRRDRRVPMATDAAGQAATATRRPAAPAGVPILAAKITAPGAPGWAVPRPRITKLIAEGTRRSPLTVVTGPPGAGKTMALALWAAAEPRAVGWISLDDYDNRPEVFWSYVVAALRRSGEEFLPRLAAALASRNPPVTLIVDDLHVLTEPPLLGELDFVLRNGGPGLRMVVSSR